MLVQDTTLAHKILAGAPGAHCNRRAPIAPPLPPCATRALRPEGSLVLITPPMPCHSLKTTHWGALAHYFRRARTAPPHPPCATRALRPVGSLVLITPPIAPTDMVMALAPTPCAPRVPESPRATPYRFTDVGTWGQSAPMGKRLRAICRGCHLVPVVANLGALWRSPISTHCPHDPESGDGGCLGGFLHPLRARRSRPAITRSLGRARPLLSQGSHCPTAYSSRHKGASSVGGRSL